MTSQSSESEKAFNRTPAVSVACQGEAHTVWPSSQLPLTTVFYSKAASPLWRRSDMTASSFLPRFAHAERKCQPSRCSVPQAQRPPGLKKRYKVLRMHGAGSELWHPPVAFFLQKGPSSEVHEGRGSRLAGVWREELTALWDKHCDLCSRNNAPPHH